MARRGVASARPRPSRARVGAWFVLMAVLAGLAAPTYRIPLDNADSAGMFAHLHAFFVQHDLLYDHAYAQLGMSPMFAFVTPEGARVVSNHWPSGATWIQGLGFALGRRGTAGLIAAGAVGDRAQWFLPILGVRALAITLVGIAVMGLARWVRDEAGPGAGVVVPFAFVVGSPLLYYAVEAPLRPHVWGCLVTCLLVWLWWHRELGGRVGRALALGSLAGLATAIRPQLAPLLLLAWHDAWPQIWRVSWRRLDVDPRRFLPIAVATLAFSIWPTTHLRLQVWLYGDLGSYGGGGAELSTHLWPFLTSTFHGVLPWTPVLVLGMLGLVLGAVWGERGAWLLLVLVAMQVWLDAGYRPAAPFDVLGSRTWAGGTSFGPRKLLDALPLLVPGAIWLARAPALRRRSVRVLSLGLVAVACAPTLALFASSLVEPKTTELILDGPAYREAIGWGLEPARWRVAMELRGLSPVVVRQMWVAIVPPLLVGATAIAWWWSRAREGARVGAIAAIVSSAGVVAHVALAVFIANSEAALREDPKRMVDAALRMQHDHIETVLGSQRAHADLMRAKLGPVVP